MSMVKEIEHPKNESRRVIHDGTIRWQRVSWPTERQAKLCDICDEEFYEGDEYYNIDN